MYQPVTNQTSCRRDNLRYEPYPQLPKCIIEYANVTQLHVLGYYSTIKKWIRAGVQQLKTIKRLVVEVDCSWDAGTLSSDYLDRDLGITGVELGVIGSGCGKSLRRKTRTKTTIMTTTRTVMMQF
jgi:hypothetical protein